MAQCDLFILQLPQIASKGFLFLVNRLSGYCFYYLWDIPSKKMIYCQEYVGEVRSPSMEVLETFELKKMLLGLMPILKRIEFHT